MLKKRSSQCRLVLLGDVVSLIRRAKEIDKFVYAWDRVIVSFHEQFSFLSERWTYQNIMVFITFAIKVAQRTYIRVIRVNMLIYC